MTNDELDRLAAEKWKPIPGYAAYEASNFGRIRSYRHKNGRRKIPLVMKLNPATKKQYAGVTLQANGKNKFFGVHRLILMAFRGMPKAGQVGCHNDGNKANNHISNLRWDTHSGNHADKWRHGTMPYGEKTNASRLSNKDIEVIKHLLKRHCRNIDIANLFGVNRSTIERIKNGKTRIFA